LTVRLGLKTKKLSTKGRIMAPSAPTRLEDVVGCLKYTGRPRTVDEMEGAIAKEIKARRDRGRY
jgi:hypothetical protein